MLANLIQMICTMIQYFGEVNTCHPVTCTRRTADDSISRKKERECNNSLRLQQRACKWQVVLANSVWRGGSRRRVCVRRLLLCWHCCFLIPDILFLIWYRSSSSFFSEHHCLLRTITIISSQLSIAARLAHNAVPILCPVNEVLNGHILAALSTIAQFMFP